MNDESLSERLQQLRDRYFLLAPPLVLLLGIGLSGSRLLGWTAGILLILLTINWLIPFLRKR